VTQRTLEAGALPWGTSKSLPPWQDWQGAAWPVAPKAWPEEAGALRRPLLPWGWWQAVQALSARKGAWTVALFR
jgi:hypothetical protein